MRSRLIFNAKVAVREALKRRGRHILYIPRIEPTGFDLVHDLGIVIDAPTPLIFDVGANVGQSLELFRRALPRGRTFAFEPDPCCFAELVRRYGGQNIQFFQIALSSTEGSEELYRYERSVLNSLLPLDPSPNNCFATVKSLGKVDIVTRKIDSLVNELGIAHLDLLKVDTQGWDYHVLRGAARSLAEGRIKSVLVELNFDPMYQGQASAEAVISYLTQQGFGLVDFYEKARRNNRLSWCTALFVK